MKTFYDWMCEDKGLKEITAKKYDGAIKGILSEWAIDNKLITSPLTSINESLAFESIAYKIRKLKAYRVQNERGHNMYHCALNKFAEYLKTRA